MLGETLSGQGEIRARVVDERSYDEIAGELRRSTAVVRQPAQPSRAPSLPSVPPDAHPPRFRPSGGAAVRRFRPWGHGFRRAVTAASGGCLSA